MRRFFAILLISSIFLGGCATVQPNYTMYESIHPTNKEDLKYTFIDISKKNKTNEKIQKQQYVKIGYIRHEVPNNKVNMEEVKTLAREQGGDAIIIKQTDFLWNDILDRYYGIEAEVIKFK